MYIQVVSDVSMLRMPDELGMGVVLEALTVSRRKLCTCMFF